MNHKGCSFFKSSERVFWSDVLVIEKDNQLQEIEDDNMGMCACAYVCKTFNVPEMYTVCLRFFAENLLVSTSTELRLLQNELK